MELYKKWWFWVVLVVVVLLGILLRIDLWISNPKYMIDSSYCESDSDCVINGDHCGIVNKYNYRSSSTRCLGEITFNTIYCSNNSCNLGPPVDFCESDSDCRDGFKCYISQLCSPSPLGVECGPQLGDLRCYKSCESDDDCEAPFKYCKEVEFYQGDVVFTHSICMKEDWISF